MFELTKSNMLQLEQTNKKQNKKQIKTKTKQNHVSILSTKVRNGKKTISIVFLFIVQINQKQHVAVWKKKKRKTSYKSFFFF